MKTIEGYFLRIVFVLQDIRFPINDSHGGEGSSSGREDPQRPLMLGPPQVPASSSSCATLGPRQPPPPSNQVHHQPTPDIKLDPTPATMSPAPHDSFYQMQGHQTQQIDFRATYMPHAPPPVTPWYGEYHDEALVPPQPPPLPPAQDPELWLQRALIQSQLSTVASAGLASHPGTSGNFSITGLIGSRDAVRHQQHQDEESLFVRTPTSVTNNNSNSSSTNHNLTANDLQNPAYAGHADERGVGGGGGGGFGRSGPFDEAQL